MLATCATTVWLVGRATMPKPVARNVMPTNSTPSRMAMAVSVGAALRASGLGLKAVTPLAMASVPVSATEPAAKARSSRKIVSGSRSRGRRPGNWSSAAAAPSPSTTIRYAPIADHQQRAAHEQVGRDGEDVARTRGGPGGCRA